MGYPPIYRKSGDVQANYSYQDIADGTGKIVFYGIASTTSAATDYHLVTDTLGWSEPIGTSKSAGTETIDFDAAPFNSPRIPKGTAWISAGIGAEASSTAKLMVQLKHWDGSTETNITDEITSQTVGASSTDMVFMPLPITTEKVFKVGDNVRLTVKLVTTTGVGVVGHDPQNRDEETGNLVPSTDPDITSTMVLTVPFKLNI